VQEDGGGSKLTCGDGGAQTAGRWRQRSRDEGTGMGSRGEVGVAASRGEIGVAAAGRE
jgi:hypothetical protein